MVLRLRRAILCIDCGLREQGTGAHGAREGKANGEGLEDQVRGQRGSAIAKFSGGNRTAGFDVTLPQRHHLPKVMVLACRCEKVTQARKTGGGTTWLPRAHEVISLDKGTAEGR